MITPLLPHLLPLVILPLTLSPKHHSTHILARLLNNNHNPNNNNSKTNKLHKLTNLNSQPTSERIHLMHSADS